MTQPRSIEKGDRVRLRLPVDGQIREVEGTVVGTEPASAARRRGNIQSKRSGTILEIRAEISPHRTRLVYKHKSKVKKIHVVEQDIEKRLAELHSDNA